MTGNDIKNAINNLDRKTLRGSSNSKKSLFISIVSGVAVAAVAVMAITFLPKLNKNNNPSEKTNNEGEFLGPITKWVDRVDFERYTGLVYEGCNYSLRASLHNPFTPKDSMGTGEVFGVDEKNEIRKITTELFSVEEVSSDIIIAAKLPWGYGYYLNISYMPKNLGELVSSLNFEKTLDVKNAAETVIDFNKSYTTIVYEADKSLLFDLFKNNSEAEALLMDFRSYSDDMSFEVIFGHNSAAFWLSEEGYLCTNVLDKGLAFNIGDEASKLIEKIRNTCPSKTFVQDLTNENSSSQPSAQPTAVPTAEPVKN